MFEKPRERFTKEEKLKDIEERKCEHNEEHEKTGQDCGKDCYFSLNIYNSSLCSPGFLAGSISRGAGLVVNGPGWILALPGNQLRDCGQVA